MKFISQKYLAIVLFGIFVSTVKSAKINSSKGFVVSKGKSCSDTNLATTKTRSNIVCVALCQRRSGCDAVNYNRKTRQCQLLGGNGGGGCLVDPNSVFIHDKSVNPVGKPFFKIYTILVFEKMCTKYSHFSW